MMPVRQARSSTGGRPRLPGPALCRGRRGSTTSHSSSGTKGPGIAHLRSRGYIQYNREGAIFETASKAIADFDEAIRLDPQIARMPFYKRYRAAAEVRRSLGLLVVVPLLAFGLCLFLAFAMWPTLRHRKPEPDKDL